jgi:LPS sulfotransferase NodH
MNLHEDQFSKTNDFPIYGKPTKILIIASTPRCGSHMLGHALHKTNKFGFPLEYANPWNLNSWKKRYSINTFIEVIEQTQKNRTSSNGVFAIKIHYSHISVFGGFDELIKLFPNAYFVLLSRSDILGQAISMSIAMQTGGWISGQGNTVSEPKYNFKQINNHLKELLKGNSSWRYRLVTSGSNFIELDFDTVVKDLSNSISKIGKFMDIGLSSSDLDIEHITKKQSNEYTIKFREQFIRDFDNSQELFYNPKQELKRFLKLRSLREL